MELPEYEKGIDITLLIKVGHYTDPVSKTGFVADDLTGLTGYYAWVFDRFRNVIASFSKNELSAGRGFLRTIDVDDSEGQFKIKIPYTITGASGTLTGEYFVSVRTQDDIDDAPYLRASRLGEPRFKLVDGVGNVFTSSVPES